MLKQEEYNLSKSAFTGMLQPLPLARLISISDLHLYWTVPFVLSWSLVDALACDCTVLASKTDPAEEFVKHGETGLLADFYDVDRFADLSLLVLREPTVYRKLGRSGAAIVNNKYSLQNTLPSLTDFFQSIARHPLNLRSTISMTRTAQRQMALLYPPAAISWSTDFTMRFTLPAGCLFWAAMASKYQAMSSTAEDRFTMPDFRTASCAAAATVHRLAGRGPAINAGGVGGTAARFAGEIGTLTATAGALTPGAAETATVAAEVAGTGADPLREFCPASEAAAGIALPRIVSAPAPTIKLEPSGNALAAATMSVPDETIVPPVYVLLPESTTLPAPFLTNRPAPVKFAVIAP